MTDCYVEMLPMLSCFHGNPPLLFIHFSFMIYSELCDILGSTLASHKTIHSYLIGRDLEGLDFSEPLQFRLGVSPLGR